MLVEPGSTVNPRMDLILASRQIELCEDEGSSAKMSGLGAHLFMSTPGISFMGSLRVRVGKQRERDCTGVWWRIDELFSYSETTQFQSYIPDYRLHVLLFEILQ